ncbi:inner membrane protein YohD [Pseudomonas fragi]|uniref:Inner membrane protein YohD n=1 Tax=Pseudomonas fragi TaxID=296 RepID=A0A449IRQ9_PSEFR|nr:inner membrane protein YohD [Pseudomonas fragi]
MFEHIDFNYLLATYGYLAIFIGCLLEGETILILGGWRHTSMSSSCCR